MWVRFRGLSRIVPAGKWAVQLVFPDVCAGCGLSGTWLCSHCAEEARKIRLATCCSRCGHPGDFRMDGCANCAGWIDPDFTLRCAYEFAGPVRKMVHLLKYRGQFARAEWCAEEINALIAELGWSFDVLIPVPLSEKRRRQRGFNQSEEIARRLCGAGGEPARVVDGIRRIRDTAPQVKLSQDERMRNVATAFEPVESLTGLRVMLVDDVVTTGSTLQECAAACRAAGAESVHGVALARDV